MGQKKRLLIVRIFWGVRIVEPLDGSQDDLTIINEENNEKYCTDEGAVCRPRDLDQKHKWDGFTYIGSRYKYTKTIVTRISESTDIMSRDQSGL
jgi:hypothetical protein